MVMFVLPSSPHTRQSPLLRDDRTPLLAAAWQSMLLQARVYPCYYPLPLYIPNLQLLLLQRGRPALPARTVLP